MNIRTGIEAGSGITVRLLGAPTVTCNGAPVPIASRKATALLAYLAVRDDEPISRDHLAGLLWGDSAGEQARASLRQALSQLRRAFRCCGLDPIRTAGDKIVFRAHGLSVDVHRLSRDDTPCSGAVEDMDKEFLEGFSVASPAFDQWSAVQRESLRSRVRNLHEQLAGQAYRERRLEDAACHLAGALRLDPLQEHLHRRLMKIYTAQGRTDAAMGQFERCREILRRELGVVPDRETTALYDSIRHSRAATSIGAKLTATSPGGRRQTVAADSGRPSIAVLPFDNMSGDPEQEYFSDGIAEDVITDLSKVSGLVVIARNSTFACKGRAWDVCEVGRKLGARYILEGSVRRAGERVRITAQMIDCETGGQVWAERYDRNLTDIFDVQDEVARDIVSALALQLTDEEHSRLTRRDTGNLEAYSYFLRGREQALRDTAEANAQARLMLEKAIELDPEFSLAFSHLARNHVLDYVNCWSASADQSLDRAVALAERAIELNEHNPHDYFALGTSTLWRKEHERSIHAARRALAIDPNFAEGHAMLGLIQVYDGRPAAAIESLDTAMRLDPYYRDIYLHLEALAHFHLERYDEAVSILKRRLVRKPESDISRVLLAATYGHLGEIEAGRDQWTQAKRVNPDYSIEHRRRILPYRNPADFERIAEGLRKAGLVQ